ncbi:MAG: peptidase S24 [Caldisericia bacterium]|nr:peptidase S24 [Caldisericia bacterium]
MTPTGFPSPAKDYMEKSLDLNSKFIKNPISTFIMKVKTGSTADGQISPGDVLIIDRSVMPKEGSPIIAIMDDELKIVYYHPKKWVHTQHTVEMWGTITFIIHTVD